MVVITDCMDVQAGLRLVFFLHAAKSGFLVTWSKFKSFFACWVKIHAFAVI